MDLKKQGLNKDINDSLKSFKSKFINNDNEIYLDGNSLGKLPYKTIFDLENVIKKQWGENLISSWNDHWLELNNLINHKMSLLINSDKGEVMVGESTSVNLYKIIHALLESNEFNKALISDSLNFPSDLYVLDGLKNLTTKNKIKIIEYKDDIKCDLNLLKKNIKTDPGIYCLSLVSYKSSYLYPLNELNKVAEENGSVIVWDCSHAIGVTEIDVKKSNIKIAIGCTYKFLNGGPGSPSFLYVSSDILEKLSNPVRGWFGHINPFDFSNEYVPSSNINKFSAGTPSILSLVPVNNGLDITLAAGIKNIRKKSVDLGNYLIELIKNELSQHGVVVASPTNSDFRGSHITIQHEEAWRICKLLISGYKKRKKVIPDFRPHNNIRLGFAPLYVGFFDLFETVMILKSILENKEYLSVDQSKKTVT